MDFAGMINQNLVDLLVIYAIMLGVLNEECLVIFSNEESFVIFSVSIHYDTVVTCYQYQLIYEMFLTPTLTQRFIL